MQTPKKEAGQNQGSEYLTFTSSVHTFHPPQKDFQQKSSISMSTMRVMISIDYRQRTSKIDLIRRIFLHNPRMHSKWFLHSVIRIFSLRQKA